MEEQHSSDSESDSEPDLEPEPEAGVPCMPSDEFDDTQATPVSNTAAPRRWAARACDTCLRCGRLGHWASECTAIVCGNCNQLGHRAADCPTPAPCWRCGELGHWAKDCPQVGPCYRCGKLGHWERDCPESCAEPAASAPIAEPPANAETRGGWSFSRRRSGTTATIAPCAHMLSCRWPSQHQKPACHGTNRSPQRARSGVMDRTKRPPALK